MITFNEGVGGQGIFVNVTGPNGVSQVLKNSQLFTSDVKVSNVVNMTASSTIDARGGKLELGILNWSPGTTLSTVSGTVNMSLTGGTNFPAAGTYTLDGGGIFDPGSVNDNALAITIKKMGTGALLLSNTTTPQFTNGGSAINVTAGQIAVAMDSTPGTMNPLGNALVTLSGGGEFVVGNKILDNLSVNPNLVFSGSAAIAADAIGGGAVRGTAAQPLSVAYSTPLAIGANTIGLLRLGRVIRSTFRAG